MSHQPPRRSQSLQDPSENTVVDDNVAPLEQFALAKSTITSIFTQLNECLQDASAFLSRPYTWIQHEAANSPIMHEVNNEQLHGTISNLADKCAENAKIVQRDKMKVAIVGITSHGKSTTVNAMLHSRVLPMGFGQTTSCFIKLSAAEDGETEPYCILPGSSEHRDAAVLRNLANVLKEGSLKASDIVSLVWPSESCALLRHDVVVYDTPGLDSDEDIDQHICSNCADADVFILVSNGIGTLSGTERRFFETVSQSIGKPNIFILLNKWDQADDDDEDSPADAVKQQHLRVCKELLVDKLGTVEPSQLQSRVFFVSNKEALEIRSGKRSMPSSHNSLSNANTRESRYDSFVRFEQEFMQCISHSAIITRFRYRAEDGLGAAQEAATILREISCQVSTHHQHTTAHMEQQESSLRELSASIVSLRERCYKAFEAVPQQVREGIRKAIVEAVQDFLPEIVERFEQPFIRSQPEFYKQELAMFVDSELQKLITPDRFFEISQAVGNAREDMYKRVQTQLPSHYQLRKRVPYIGNFNVHVGLDCSTLADFREDIGYQFIFGWQRVASNLPENMRISCENIGIRLYRTGRRVFSDVIMRGFQGSAQDDEKDQPVRGMLSTVSSEASGLMDTWNLMTDLGALWPFWSMGLAVWYAAPSFVSRNLFKYAAIAGIGLGVAYAIDYTLYTDAKRLSKLKHQFVEHATQELNQMAGQSARTTAISFESSLKDNCERLFTEVETIQGELEQDVHNTRDILAVLDTRLETARSLQSQTNSLHLSMQDFVRKHFSSGTTSPSQDLHDI